MPRGLPKSVKKCLEKSVDSALLAVETYNKPAVKFKSGGYIVLMVFLGLLYFTLYSLNKKKTFCKTNNRFDKKDGDYCYWELSACLKEYFKTDTNNPIEKTLNFLFLSS